MEKAVSLSLYAVTLLLIALSHASETSTLSWCLATGAQAAEYKRQVTAPSAACAKLDGEVPTSRVVASCTF